MIQPQCGSLGDGEGMEMVHNLIIKVEENTLTLGHGTGLLLAGAFAEPVKGGFHAPRANLAREAFIRKLRLKRRLQTGKEKQTLRSSFPARMRER